MPACSRHVKIKDLLWWKGRKHRVTRSGLWARLRSQNGGQLTRTWPCQYEGTAEAGRWTTTDRIQTSIRYNRLCSRAAPSQRKICRSRGHSSTDLAAKMSGFVLSVSAGIVTINSGTQTERVFDLLAIHRAPVVFIAGDFVFPRAQPCIPPIATAILSFSYSSAHGLEENRPN